MTKEYPNIQKSFVNVIKVPAILLSVY